MISVAKKANGSGVKRALVVLVLLWAVLAARIGLALVRHESLAGDLSLPASRSSWCLRCSRALRGNAPRALHPRGKRREPTETPEANRELRHKRTHRALWSRYVMLMLWESSESP